MGEGWGEERKSVSLSVCARESESACVCVREIVVPALPMISPPAAAGMVTLPQIKTDWSIPSVSG